MTPGEALDFFRRLSCTGAEERGKRTAKRLYFSLSAAYDAKEPHPQTIREYNATLNLALAALTRVVGMV